MSPSRDSRNSWRNAAMLAGLLVLVAAAYLPGVGGGFIFDDFPNIVRNVRVHLTAFDGVQLAAAWHASPAADLPRPLAMLSFAVNHYFTALDPRAMKLTNIVIHLVNVALAAALARRLLGLAGAGQREQAFGALAVAAAWGLMPIHVATVLLVVQRMELLANVFVLLGLLAYIRLRASTRSASMAVLAVCVLAAAGCLAKESAALLPLYALLLECLVFRFEGVGREGSARLKLHFAMAFLVAASVGAYKLGPYLLDDASFAHREFGPWQRIATEWRVLVQYLHWIVLPTPQSLGLFHDDIRYSTSLLQPVSTLLSGLFLAGLAASAWALRRALPLAALGLSWFLASHLLTASFLPLELVFEHRNYFGAFGIAMVLWSLLARLAPSHRRGSLACGLLLLALYSGVTLIRTSQWSSPLVFASTEAAKNPESPRAAMHHGQILAELAAASPQDALVAAATAELERGRRIRGSGIGPAQALVVLAARTGSPVRRELWDEIEDRLRSRPMDSQQHGALAQLTNCSIDGYCRPYVDEMMSVFGAALSRGDDPEVLSIYGNYAYNVLGDPSLTERLWLRAHQLRPQEPEYIVSLVKLNTGVGRLDVAQKWIARLRALGTSGQHEAVADDLERRVAARAASIKAEAERVRRSDPEEFR